MKNIFVIIISTEDGEKYMNVYGYEPKEVEIKEDFFSKYGHIGYEESDWLECISYEITETSIKE